MLFSLIPSYSHLATSFTLRITRSGIHSIIHTCFFTELIFVHTFTRSITSFVHLTFGTSMATSLMALGLTWVMASRRSEVVIFTLSIRSLSEMPGVEDSTLLNAWSPEEEEEKSRWTKTLWKHTHRVLKWNYPYFPLLIAIEIVFKMKCHVCVCVWLNK